MRQSLIAVQAAVTAVAVSLGGAVVAAAAPGAGNANDVINELKANGYRVIITKSGAGDMSKCTVTSVEKQSPVTDVGAGRDAQNYPTTVPVTSRKIAVVALRC
ncbi:hypothetical protein [Mycobacteroides abscessus]|uniref:hypothetical protein n=1 Tax=Mycobacteroides abscessus TaxID=36809 RepID=UPI0002E0D32C|nr:hypothetical protein [Mycobacteroides abscessus]SKV38215.1 Uncharacterised protein [Mycobacteroides abscessus subsp. abscessus]ORA23999.1 hypothetical protein BST18_20830 [Mycobacteroides abscessus subsp. bolletii]TPF67811.1 hypothetical protein XW60_10720 [Mycobacteroides abscessus subsp. bolletii]SHU25806.1 Uncharacterised protein [Mycobacteroides abscessus subsp. bolletii]SHW15030.1 Uncharacterised protein [Mycobacteroides abscessus subsp. bolletii]